MMQVTKGPLRNNARIALCGNHVSETHMDRDEDTVNQRNTAEAARRAQHGLHSLRRRDLYFHPWISLAATKIQPASTLY